MIARQGNPRRRCGFSMLEAVISLTLLSIVMVSVGSAMIFAAQATPDDDSAVITTLRDHKVLAQIADDLSQAMYITEQSPTAITIVVPDRTGDGIPDRIRYAWGGSSGGALKYTINETTSVNLIDSAHSFNLTYDIGTDVQTLPGQLVYGNVQLISSFTTTLLASSTRVSTSTSLAQNFTPTLSSGAIAFLPTRFDLYVRSSSPVDAEVGVALQNRSGSSPGAEVYADSTLVETALGSGSQWVSLTPDTAALVPDGEPLSLVCSYLAGSSPALHVYSNTSLSGGMITSTNGGTNWSNAGANSLCYRVYGREVTQANDIEVTRERYRAVTVSVSTQSTQSSATQKVRLLNQPEKLDRFWEADFSANPTDMDLDADDVTDWLYPPVGVPEAERTGGRWSISGPLQAQPTGVFEGVVTIEARLLSTTGDGLGIFGPYTGAGDDLCPMVVQLRQDDSGGQELIVYNSILYANPIASIPVAQGWADIRLTLIPAEDRLTIEVNGEIAGTVKLDHIVNDTIDRTFSVRPIGTDGEIDYIRAKVGGTYTVDSSSSGGGLVGGGAQLAWALT